MSAFRLLPLLLLGSATVALAQSAAPPAPPAEAQAGAADALLDGFKEPPEAAKPRVWWHWLSGNVDQQGIRKDLEWMKRTGIGGMQMFDGDLGSPQVVPKRVAALTPEWLDSLRFAAAEADRLGLEFAMAAAPGWSETGGPWIDPAKAMKKLVWSETRVNGGTRRPRLSAPPDVAGPFQDIPRQGRGGAGAAAAAPIPPFYRDVAVVAHRLHADDRTLAEAGMQVSYSAGALDLAKLTDGRLTETVELARPMPQSPVWVRYAFARPELVGALTFTGPLPGRFNDGPAGRIETSDDAERWTVRARLPGGAQNPAPERTVAFTPVRARYMRVVFESLPTTGRAARLQLAELAPVLGARVNAWEDKAGFGVLAAADTVDTPDAGMAAIAPNDVVDLTGKLRADGTLDWTAPAGRWAILRMGWTPTGTVNHPATPEVTGLEADKLDPASVRAHLDAYMAPVAERLNGLIGNRGLRYMLTDSWEAGVQNWTPTMAAEFRKRRGYDLTPWLPVLTGRVVESAAASDRFLWDYRRTIADLIASSHYGTITAWAKERGLGYYGEAVGASWPTIADGIQAKRYTDIPMSEYWAIPFGGQPAAFQGVRSDEFPADVVEAASTAHLYGRPFVAAEALTSSLPIYSASPWTLKWVADKYMAMGINRHVLHTSPHQPVDDKQPGLTLGAFTQAFTRHETWAEMAEPWIRYLSRSSYMLQQGRTAADILYFYGEGAPAGVPYRTAVNPAVPEGYTADWINAEALLDLVRVENGELVTPAGGRYRVLVLPNDLTGMTVPVATKLRDLVRAGAVLVGPRPTRSPSLTSSDADLHAITDEIWGGTDGRLATHAAVGQGHVYAGRPLADVLEERKLAPDFAYPRLAGDAPIVFAHRTTPDSDIYFVSNQGDAARKVDVRFRVDGRAAEIWRADTGEATPARATHADGLTTVPLDLAPYDAQFVVFRRPAAGAVEPPPATEPQVVARADGRWTRAFQPGRGAPEGERPATLGSWTADTDPGVRYFSGVATYRTTLKAPGRATRGRAWIDLGGVDAIARVRVNGRDAGVAWKAPWRVEVTGLIRSGANRIEIEVANLWRNRLIGDLQPGAAKVAMTSAPTGGTATAGGGFGGGIGSPPRADSPLLPSGLIGPVTLLAEGPQ